MSCDNCANEVPLCINCFCDVLLLEEQEYSFVWVDVIVLVDFTVLIILVDPLFYILIQTAVSLWQQVMFSL
jgi:hypothetical protein